MRNYRSIKHSGFKQLFKKYYYFISSHLIKLFDSMASLKFEIDNGRKYAMGMIAKDGEFVEFNHPCDCSGPVSFTLNHLSNL